MFKQGLCDLCERWDTSLVDGVGACCRPAMALRDNWMETISGNKVSLAFPDPTTIDIADIAYSLSRLARFNGHTQGLPYSVARHSLWVSEYLRIAEPKNRRLQMYGLLHDAHEAYTGDVILPVTLASPVLKQALSEIKQRIQAAVFVAMELPRPNRAESQLIKEADGVALRQEARHLMPSNGMEWQLPEMTAVGSLMPPPIANSPDMDREAFMRRFWELHVALGGLQ